ncbi:MAG: hypothetical protein KDC92_10345 [Bacteroidetes bacterium]|nr:hypothetical protein [Bacteroidota bacterium]
MLKVNFNSPLLIGGWAGQEHWPKFKTAKPRSWAGGLMKTRIENKYVELEQLAPFT